MQVNGWFNSSPDGVIMFSPLRALPALHPIFPSRPFFSDIAKIKEVIKDIDKKIKQVSKLDFHDESGNPMSQERAEAERATLYNAYGEERVKAEKRLKVKEFNLLAHTEWRKRMGIDFTLGEIDENTETATWYVKFYGTKDAGEIEDLLIHKLDWGGIKLACSSAHPRLPPWAGRGPIPDGSKSFLPNYVALEVNVAGVRFSRVPHGVGTFKELDRESANISSDKFSLYYGNWEGGKKMGHGIYFDDIGVFAGRFVDGLRNGHGRLDLADGTTITGHFSHEELREEKENTLFENPYKDGEPNGTVEILFSDGGLYRGHVRNATINGFGEYQSAFGDVFVGHFKDGVLDGPHGLFKNNAGETFRGTWCNGELSGVGYYENHRGDTYEGYFDSSMRHVRM
jgi:hypothetical protein